jgi:hypothetical protein
MLSYIDVVVLSATLATLATLMTLFASDMVGELGSRWNVAASADWTPDMGEDCARLGANWAGAPSARKPSWATETASFFAGARAPSDGSCLTLRFDWLWCVWRDPKWTAEAEAEAWRMVGVVVR